MQTFGILNLTDDSFFEPKKYLDTDKALKKVKQFIKYQTHALDIGAVASNPKAKIVQSSLELARIEKLLKKLKQENLIGKIKISIDCYSSQTQTQLLSKNWPFVIDYLNDINGFNDPKVYDHLKQHNCKIVVMHSIQKSGPADLSGMSSGKILKHIYDFFDDRLNNLAKSGICESRFVIDPGMGFFLGKDPKNSLKVINDLPKLKKKFKIPVMISVSKKSFIRKIAGCSIKQSLVPTIVAELYANSLGADFIRTHDVQSLTFAKKIWQALKK